MHSECTTGMLKALRNPFSISVLYTLEGENDTDIFRSRPLKVAGDREPGGKFTRSVKDQYRSLRLAVELRMEKRSDREGLLQSLGPGLLNIISSLTVLKYNMGSRLLPYQPVSPKNSRSCSPLLVILFPMLLVQLFLCLVHKINSLVIYTSEARIDFHQHLKIFASGSKEKCMEFKCLFPFCLIFLFPTGLCKKMQFEPRTKEIHLCIFIYLFTVFWMTTVC